MKTYATHLFIISSLMFLPCVQAQHVLDQTVATELLRESTGQLAVGALQQNEDFQRRYTASVLEQELAQEAGRRGLPERIDVQRALQMSRMRILIEALKADVVRDVPSPTEEEIETVYKESAGQLKIAEAVKVDMYVLSKDDPASDKFADRAVRKDEIDPETISSITGRQVVSADNGGWVAKASLTEEIWEKLESGKDGRVYRFDVDEGIVLAKRHEYREERQPTMDEARAQLRTAITQQRQQRRWAEFLQQSRQKIGFTN